MDDIESYQTRLYSISQEQRRLDTEDSQIIAKFLEELSEEGYEIYRREQFVKTDLVNAIVKEISKRVPEEEFEFEDNMPAIKDEVESIVKDIEKFKPDYKSR